MNLDEMAKTDGQGRDVLERRIAELVAECRELREKNAAHVGVCLILARDNQQMLDNLTATQTRCTELLEQYRTALACGYGGGLEKK
ncbi:MAG: hypothetical protein ACYDDA_04985 [Acidiferrobacteraceae bacterium]|jgi:hypothetical protein|nr:hypothetical protein [Gemmatimonadaceae bacterium]